MIAKGFVPSEVKKPSRSWESHENAASPSALSGNQKFQDPETSRLTTADHQVINRRVLAAASLPHRRGWVQGRRGPGRGR